jgi:cytochrome c oxidase cbb3-type subunit IV
MLKSIKQYAASIEGISIYPVVSLLIFLVFFIVLLYYVKKMSRSKVEAIRNLPLEGNDEAAPTITSPNLKHV